MSNIDSTTERAAPSDAELIVGARAGDDTSYGALYERHVAAARAAARNLARNRSQVDDLVSEAFTRVLSAIRRGGGPEVAFRPYLLTSLRNAYYDRAGSIEGRLSPVELGPEITDDFRTALADPLIGPEDRALIATAFVSLPERWQLVLWHTEVEGQSAAQVAPLLGLAPNAVAALSYRAREGLREAYLQAHLQHEPPPPCREARGKLGAYARNGLSERDRTMVDQHLDSCDGCRGLLVELRDVSSALRSVVAPAILGAPLAAYLHHVAGAKGLARLRPRTKTQQAALASAVVAAVIAIGLIANAAIGGGGSSPKLGAPAPSITAPSTSAPPTTTARFPTTSRATTTLAPTTLAPTTAVPITASAPIVPTATTSAATTTTTSEPSTTTEATSTTVVATTLASTAAPTFATTTAVTLKPTTTAVTLKPTVPTLPPTSPKPVADLSVSGSLLGPLVNGRSVYLSAVVANAGPNTADAVTVTMTLPSSLTFGASASPGWTCRAAGLSVVMCTLGGALVNAARSTLLVQVDVPPPAVVAASPAIVVARSFAAAVAPTTSVTMTVASTATDPSSTANSTIVALPPPTDGGMAALYATVDRGNITMTGASLMACDTKEAGCSDALANAPRAPSTVALDNGSYTMSAIDTDTDGTTTASSSATLAIPASAEVTKAYLVWGATAFDGIDASAVKNFGSARLTRRDGPTIDVVGVGISTTLSKRNVVDAVYARADVTAQIRADRSGSYTFASVGGYTGTGTNRAGGWALVVVYTDDSEPMRSLVVLDGLVGYGSGATKPTLEMSLGGLGPVAAGVSVPVRFGVVGFDGDRGRDDAIVISSAAPDPVSVTDANNPAEDVMNSTVSINGTLQPGDPNTMGFDADLVDLTLVGGGNLDLAATGPSDQIRLGLITLSAPAS